MTTPKQSPQNKKAKSLLSQPHPDPLKDCTFAMLPDDPSETGARARRVAAIIGNPLQLPGVNPETRKLLEHAIKSGDPHGMLDFGAQALAQAEGPVSEAQTGSKKTAQRNPLDTPATVPTTARANNASVSPENTAATQVNERGIGTPLSESSIREAARAYYKKYGELPEARRDREVPGMPGESWIGINVAGFYGHRGLRKGRTLREVLKPLRKELGL